MAADLAAQLPTQRTDRELAEKERVERADRSRLLFWRVETLIGAGYAPEQSGQLGRDLAIDVAEAVDLLRIGVATNVGAPRPGWRPRL